MHDVPRARSVVGTLAPDRRFGRREYLDVALLDDSDELGRRIERVRLFDDVGLEDRFGFGYLHCFGGLGFASRLRRAEERQRSFAFAFFDRALVLGTLGGLGGLCRLDGRAGTGLGIVVDGHDQSKRNSTKFDEA